METTDLSKREFLTCSFYSLCGIVAASNFGFVSQTIANSKYNEEDKKLQLIREAMYYTITPRGAKCENCPVGCTIKPNEKGECKTKKYINNKLYTIAYGNPCSVNNDPIEKKPLFHFLPASKSFSIATAGCNFACLNCQNWEISQKSPEETQNYDLSPQQVVDTAIKYGSKSIAYTYAEPVVFYEYMFDTAKIAKSKEIKNVLISNGYINQIPLKNLAKYIDAANINLKSFSDTIYKKLNAGTLQPVLDTLKTLRDEKVWFEITNLIIPNWTDDLDMIKRMCDWLYTNNLHIYPLHFSRFFPLYKLTQLPATPTDILDKAREIALNAGIKYVYIGNVPGTKAENTFCPKCKKMIIERKGFRILANHIENNLCKFCKEKIHGVWK